MKRNIKFLTIVTSLLLVSSFILSGFMYAIAADNGEAKAYDLNVQKNTFAENSSQGGIIEDAPIEQGTMKEKFDAYLHVENGNVTVFSEEQYADLKSVRDEGKRNPLSYEEILFLMYDSINLYFTYDEIKLTNAICDDILPLKYYLNTPSYVIYPENKDFNEYFDYYSSNNAYKKMLNEIYEIIYYRIYMHDAGFAEVIHYNQYLENRTEHIAGGSSADNYNEENGYIISAAYKLLSIDESTVGGLENEEKLVNEYRKLIEWQREFSSVGTDKKTPEINSHILGTKIIEEANSVDDFIFYIISPSGNGQLIYPTQELINMQPCENFNYIAKASDVVSSPVFYLDHYDVTVSMSTSMVSSFAAFGLFKEHDGVLQMHFAHDDDGYYYVFHKQNDCYVYSAEESKPLPLDGFDFSDGLSFVKERSVFE